jgi:uncharacterized membrane protein
MGRNPLVRAGFVLGFGMGGFLDGIILHQVLQWHHFISNIYPSTTIQALEINTLWDGIFHSVTYVITAVGLVLLWRAINQAHVAQSPRTIFGAFLLGMGSFNIFDSIVNHWILQIHHIRSGPNQLAYDLGFFAIGIILAAIGWVQIRSATRSLNVNKLTSQ